MVQLLVHHHAAIDQPTDVRNALYIIYYPALVQGVKQLICPSIVVVVDVVGTKIARSRVLGVCVCCKHNQLVDIIENWFLCV